MRSIATLIAMPMLALMPAAPVSAQTAALGQLEVKAYEKIPKTKTAVQLTSDTALGRQLRREVMVRLSRRGNEVGFSGGNVMRMDVTYIDLLGGGGSSSSTIDPSRSLPLESGANPRLELPENRIGPRASSAGSTPTLRITLTLYSTDGGRVLWQAVTSCGASDANVQRVGEAMIDAVFDSADANRIADAGCPL